MYPGKIGPLDGKVGSITPGGTHFITSANQNFILAPPLGEREVRLRTDTRYGDDDPVLWPQPYMSHNCHFACIPRPNSLADHEIIWWTPTYDHFVPFRSSLSPVGGLGKLSPLKYGVLKSSVDSLLLRAKNYQEATAASSRPPMLQPIVKWLEHCLFQLGSVYATFRQVEFLVRDLQRVWLELRALLDYMEIFKPRIDGNAPAVIEPAETTGAFTTSVRVAQDFFTAGLPFWLLRPASELTDQVVHAVVELAQPESFPDLTLTPHPRYPVIFKGSSSSLEKYQSIHDFARNFLRCSDDPFKAPGVRQPSATFSSVPPLDPLNNQLDTQAGPSRRLPSVRPGPRRESGRQQSGQRSFRQQRGELLNDRLFIYSLPLQVVRRFLVLRIVTNLPPKWIALSPLCLFRRGMLPWQQCNKIPLEWMCVTGLPTIENTFSLNLAFLWLQMKCVVPDILPHGSQSSLPVFTVSCPPHLHLLCQTKNGEISLSVRSRLELELHPPLGPEPSKFLAPQSVNCPSSIMIVDHLRAKP